MHQQTDDRIGEVPTVFSAAEYVDEGFTACVDVFDYPQQYLKRVVVEI